MNIKTCLDCFKNLLFVVDFLDSELVCLNWPFRIANAIVFRHAPQASISHICSFLPATSLKLSFFNSVAGGGGDVTDVAY
jgi:hypothetical protein